MITLARTTLYTIMWKDSATAQPLTVAASRESPKLWAKEESRNSLDLTVLGVCSGAALDEVSCALLRYRQQHPDGPLRVSILKHGEVAVPLELRTQILNLLRNHLKHSNAIVRVHDLLGYLHATSAKCFCSNHDIPVESIYLIASQADSMPPSVTLSMPPTQTSGTAPAFRSWAAVIAAETGTTTVTSLPTTRRPANQGNPTVGPPADSLFLQHPEKFRVCATIGELLHISVIPPAKDERRTPPPSSVCGPGTMFIDYAMRYTMANRIKNDRSGHYSSQGTPNPDIVDRFFQVNDYSTRVPSLSIATEMFGDHEAQGVIDECLFLGMTGHDTVATITRITAENIVHQYRRLVAAYCTSDRRVDELFLCGPGARNMDIVDYLEEVLPDELVTRPLDDVGIPGDAKEATCCAHLGLESILRFAAAEGGPLERRQQVGLVDSVVKGKQWDTLREHIPNFNEGKEVSAVKRVMVDKWWQATAWASVGPRRDRFKTDDVTTFHVS